MKKMGMAEAKEVGNLSNSLIYIFEFALRKFGH
jgi:hypothetical protein